MIQDARYEPTHKRAATVSDHSLPSPAASGATPTGWTVTVIQDKTTDFFDGTAYVVCAAP